MHNNKKLIIILYACTFLIIRCSSNETKILLAESGSNLSVNGSISDQNLTFIFKKYSGDGKVKNLFNFLYFEGDTLCFSFKINKKFERDQINVIFINPENGDPFPAERIELYNQNLFGFSHNSTVYGFSLVGSIMESFFNDELKKPIPAHAYCCKDIRFTVRIVIKENDSFIKYEMPGAFRIKYK